MIGRRTFVNLVTVIIASVVLVLFAVTQLLATAILDNDYPLFVELSEAGGLLENKQVTYRGVAVGEIVDVTLCGAEEVPLDTPACSSPQNVMVEMGIEDGVEIPRGVDVVVLRQSAVGEQALDIRPHTSTGPATTYYAARDLVDPDDVTLPTKPQDLLELANDVFGPVDPDSAATLVSELADAVEGRGEDLQSIMVDSATLSESVADNGADYDRLFAASRIVNASLAENRVALTQLITDLADGAQLIGDIRGEIDGLLDSAPPVLDATTSLLQRSDANLACVMRDLGNFNAYTNQPENFANLEEAIRVNTYFFTAFRLIGPTSAQGDPWLRVHFISEPAPPAREYVPERAIPATLPGGACESVFGPGAGSAVQPNHQLAVPEGRVIRPEDDRQTSAVAFTAASVAAAGTGAQEVAATDLSAARDGSAGDAGAVTGSGLAILLAVGLLAVGARLGRRRVTARTQGGRRG